MDGLERLKYKCDELIKVNRELNDQVVKLKTERFKQFNGDDCWIYAGDGTDCLEDLSCPVVIAPKMLLDLEKKARTKDYFNQLEPEQGERLFFLIEEMGEVLQEVGKILRHGKDSYHPDHDPSETNQIRFEKEVGDVMGVLDFLMDKKDLNQEVVMSNISKKREKLKRYSHHQD